MLRPAANNGIKLTIILLTVEFIIGEEGKDSKIVSPSYRFHISTIQLGHLFSIHPNIIMNKLITHSGHFLPRNL